MKLSAIMTRPPITARDDTPVEEVAARMIARRVGCLPIVSDGGQLRGDRQAARVLPQLEQLWAHNITLTTRLA